jgi:hypothetical protein
MAAVGKALSSSNSDDVVEDASNSSGVADAVLKSPQSPRKSLSSPQHVRWSEGDDTTSKNNNYNHDSNNSKSK